LQQGFDENGGQCARSAFDRDLGIGRNRKLTAQGGEYAQQLRVLEDGGRSSAEVDGISGFLDNASQSRRELARAGDIFEQAGDVVFVSGL
jgi:hypothetical protein